MRADNTYGLLLPHFGDEASPSTIIDAAQKAESYGIDAVWARDHLFWHPHDFEGDDPTFVEPFTALSSVAAATEEIKVGTAVAIPLRHPLHLAQLFASLDYMSDGRAICGLGGGSGEHEFEAVDLPYDKRPEIIEDNINIMRGVWNESDFTYDGNIFSVEGVNIDPKPEDAVPIWYGGTSPASVRRSVEMDCEGWFPGRLNDHSMRIRMKQARELAEEHGRDPPLNGYIPITSIDEDPDRAVEKANVDEMLDLANRRPWFKKRDGTEFSTVEDTEGVLVIGTPDDVADKIREYHSWGVDHFVFDLRFTFDELDYCLDLIGEEVLPQLR